MSAGCVPRLFFDNLDFKVLVNIILQNHRHSDMHWIAHYVTFDRVPSDHLDDSKPISDGTRFENIEYLLCQSELEKLRSDFIVFMWPVFLLNSLNSWSLSNLPYQSISNAGRNNYN